MLINSLSEFFLSLFRISKLSWWAYLSFVLLYFPSVALATPEISVEVDPIRATTRDSVVMRVSVAGNQIDDLEEPVFDDSEYFSPRSVGRSTNHQIVNGQHSLSIEFSYALQYRRKLSPGRYNTPGGTIKIASRTFALPIRSVEIVEDKSQGANDSEDLVKVFQRVSTESPYVGQQVLHETIITTELNFSDAELAPVEYLGVWKEGFGDQAQVTSQRGRTTVITVRQALFSTEATENLTLPPRELKARYRVPVRHQRGSRGIWDPFFGDPFGGFGMFQDENRQYFSEALNISARPLPPPPVKGINNIPVGNVRIKSSVDRHSLELGESVTMKVALTGDANLRPVTLGNLKDIFGGSFKIYEDEPQIAVKVEQDRVIFTKTFSLAIVPQVSGAVSLPIVTVYFFDPQSGGYKDLRTSPVTLTVKPGKGAEQLVAVGAQNTNASPNAPTNKREVSSLGVDLMPQAVGAHLTKSSYAFSGLSLLIWLLVLPFFSIVTRAIIRHKEQIRSNPKRRAQIAAFSTALSALKDAASSKNTDLKFEWVNVLGNYLRDKLALEEASLGQKRIGEIVEQQTKNKALAQKARELSGRIERLRYGGKLPDSDTGMSLIHEIELLIRELEGVL